MTTAPWRAWQVNDIALPAGAERHHRDGDGHSSGNEESDALAVTYTLRAQPRAGEIFNAWSGTIVSDNARLTFTMQEGWGSWRISWRIRSRR